MRRHHVASTLIRRHFGTKCPLGYVRADCAEPEQTASAQALTYLLFHLHDLRIIICFRKSEVTVERISFCNVSEKLMEQGNHCLPCSYTNDVIDLLP